jgi:hypothetical protein
VLLDEFGGERGERDARCADAVDEENFAAGRRAPFVGADAAVGGGDVAGSREGGWWVVAGGELVGLDDG